MANEYIFIDAASGGNKQVYTQGFLVSAWNLNGSLYEIIISAATHGQGSNPLVEIDEEVAPNSFEEVTVSGILMDNLGNITIQVTANIDNRFDGRVRILGD